MQYPCLQPGGVTTSSWWRTFRLGPKPEWPMHANACLPTIASCATGSVLGLQALPSIKVQSTVPEYTSKEHDRTWQENKDADQPGQSHREAWLPQLPLRPLQQNVMFLRAGDARPIVQSLHDGVNVGFRRKHLELSYDDKHSWRAKR